MVPPRVRCVGSEEKLSREFRIRKVAQMRVTRTGISEMTMTSAFVKLPTFPDKLLKALL